MHFPGTHKMFTNVLKGNKFDTNSKEKTNFSLLKTDMTVYLSIQEN